MIGFDIYSIMKVLKDHKKKQIEAKIAEGIPQPSCHEDMNDRCEDHIKIDEQLYRWYALRYIRLTVFTFCFGYSFAMFFKVIINL